MTPAALPADEEQRLDALRDLQVLDTAAESEFDALVKAASLVCGVPIALISLVDAQRQWFKANVGLEGVSETPRDLAFCAHAIHDSRLMEVPDALADTRFADNPLVTGAPGIRFYAGAPLQLADGSRVGTLCVIDREPKQLTPEQRAILEQLATAAARALQTRRAELAFKAQQGLLQDLSDRQRQQYEATPAMLYTINAQGYFLTASDRFLQALGYTREEVIGKRPTHYMTPESAQRARELVFPQFLQTGSSEKVHYQMVRKHGAVMDVLVSAVLVRDAQGQPLHSLSAVEDVTQRLQAEHQLREERGHLANIVKGTGAGTWEHDLVTGEDRVNDIYAHMLGYTVEEIAARIAGNFFNIVHPDDQEHVGIRWNAHMRGESPEYEAEFRAQHKDGHWVWLLSRGGIGQRSASGQPLNFSGIHLDVSSRRNAVDLATRAMRDLQNTLDALPSMVAYWDKDLRYRFANRAYGARYGIRPDKLAGMRVQEVLSPELFALNQPYLQAALAGQEQSFEREVVNFGVRRHSSVRYVPDWVDGQVHGIYVFIFDITDIKEAQQALALEREQLSNILEGTNAGTWQLNVVTGEAVVNERWASMSGYTLEDLKDIHIKTWTALIHPEDRANIVHAMQEHLEGRTAFYKGQYRMRTKSGGWMWVQDRAKISSRDANGRPLWVSGTHLDANDRVQAEIRLHEQLQFVEVLLEATPTAIYLKDAQGRYLRFNKAFEQLFGIDRADWIGKTVMELVGGESGLQMHERDLALLASGEPQIYEAIFTNRRTGMQREGLYYKAPLRDAQGQVTGLVGTILDVTERNQDARDLEAAIKVAEAATETKGRFLANMSHELRTPMNAVLGMLKLLQTTELTARQLDYASKTETAAKSLLDLLNDILDFSKMDAGKMELDPQPFRLDRLMRDLAVVLSANIGNKNVEVLYDMDPQLPDVVVGDAMRLRQVLINLGGNAVKFTENGQVVVSVRRVSGDSPAHAALIEFAVTDSGIGIAPDNQARIFSGFSQAEASTTRRFGGTGLGLAISQRLVELMGGRIAIDSALGQGSRFWFRVALPQPSVIPLDMQVTKSRPPWTKRVLVVDDNAIARNLVARVTQSWSWPTHVVGSGEEALALIARASTADAFPFDVVFVDWQMPGLDGWETTARIRSVVQERGQAQPQIIMVTANGRESLSQRTAQEQAMLSGFLVKPVTASMLLDAVVSDRPESLGLRSRQRSSRRQLAGMRILVVEDNLINQQVAEELLNSEGALVSLAADGRQGVNAVVQASTPYDVVLMDIQMPVLDGYAATREIRALPGMASLPIIGLTANAMASDREACLQAGMNEHMGKPFDLAQLVSLLIRITGKHPSDASAPLVQALAEAQTVAPVAAPTPLVAAAGPITDDLDLNEALRRLSGMQSLYIRAAREFQKSLDALEPALDALLQASDTAAAARLLHTYKGTSGTLGFVRLARCVAELEALGKAGGSAAQLRQHLPHLSTVVAGARTALLQALQTLGAEPVPSAPGSGAASLAMAGAMDASCAAANRVLDAPARAALQSMLALLEQSDLGVLQQFATVRTALESLPAYELEQLEHALQALDLAGALQICQALLHDPSA